jgi:hypothetical protein
VLSLEEAQASKEEGAPPDNAVVRWFKKQYHAIAACERGRDARWRAIRLTHLLVKSRAFLVVVYGTILLNLIALCVDHYPQSEELTDALFICNLIFNIIFTLEILCKVMILHSSLDIWVDPMAVPCPHYSHISSQQLGAQP